MQIKTLLQMNRILIGLLIFLAGYAFWMREFTIPGLKQERDSLQKDYAYLSAELKRAQDNPQIETRVDTVTFRDTVKIPYPVPVERTDSTANYIVDFNKGAVSGTIYSFITGKDIKLKEQRVVLNTQQINLSTTVTRTVITPLYFKEREQGSRPWRLQVGGFVSSNMQDLQIGPSLQILSPKDNSYFIQYNPYSQFWSVGTHLTLRFK